MNRFLQRADKVLQRERELKGQGPTPRADSLLRSSKLFQGDLTLSKSCLGQVVVCAPSPIWDH